MALRVRLHAGCANFPLYDTPPPIPPTPYPVLLIQSQPCGGFDSFDLYKLPAADSNSACSGDAVELYEQVGFPGFVSFLVCL